MGCRGRIVVSFPMLFTILYGHRTPGGNVSSDSAYRLVLDTVTPIEQRNADEKFLPWSLRFCVPRLSPVESIEDLPGMGTLCSDTPVDAAMRCGMRVTVVLDGPRTHRLLWDQL